MAESVVEIVNLAATELGASSFITSLDDASKLAIQAKLNWPSVRDAVLRAYPWNCAIKRDILAPLADAPTYKWTYQFQLPADCLRVLGMKDSADDYAIEGRTLMYDGNVAYIKYITRVEDVTQYDALLVDALVARLAHRLCVAITQSTAMKDSMWESYRAKIREARSIDAQESSPQELEANEWLDARVGLPHGQELRNPV